jgi:hypothetical protein
VPDEALIRSPAIVPDDELAALVAEIVRGREQLAVSWGALQGRLQRATSWRHWAGSHPAVWLCAGVFMGFRIGWGPRRR